MYHKFCEHKIEERSCKICLPFTCEKCNKIYSKNYINEHTIKCNPNKPKKIYTCELCPDSDFRDSWCLKRHYKGSPNRHKNLLTDKEYIDAINYWKNKIK